MAVEPPERDRVERSQRVRVGITGLALVVVLGGLAGALFNAVSDERPVGATGARDAQIVAEMTGAANTATAVDSRVNEPLAELGVAPSTGAENESGQPARR